MRKVVFAHGLPKLLAAADKAAQSDPWGKKELALLYAVPFATLLLTGAGSWSLDGLLPRRKAQSVSGRDAPSDTGAAVAGYSSTPRAPNGLAP